MAEQTPNSQRLCHWAIQARLSPPFPSPPVPLSIFTVTDLSTNCKGARVCFIWHLQRSTLRSYQLTKHGGTARAYHWGKNAINPQCYGFSHVEMLIQILPRSHRPWVDWILMFSFTITADNVVLFCRKTLACHWKTTITLANSRWLDGEWEEVKYEGWLIHYSHYSLHSYVSVKHEPVL